MDRILSSRRGDEGKWDQVYVEDNSGGAAQIFLGRDKPEKRVATETGAEQLHVLLCQPHSDMDFYHKCQDGEIHSNWMPVAKVDFVSSAECKLLWASELASETRH